MGRKIIRFIDNSIDFILTIVFIITLLIGVYALYDTYYVYNHAQDKSLLKYKPLTQEEVVDAPKLEGYVAWLTIYDTNIDYPIMQGIDNTEYLNKDPYGEFSLSGSIFLDSRNNKDFSDSYSLIYGHHMQGNIMFGGLDNYFDKDFFDTHREGKLVVADKEYKLRVFAICSALATEETVFDPENSNNIEEYIESNALIYYSNTSKNIIGLSTCVDGSSPQRTIVFAELFND